MVEVNIKADSRYPVDRQKIRQAVRSRLDKTGVVSRMLVSVAVVGDRKMKQLARDFYGDNKTHDVLSFPYLDPQSQPVIPGYHQPESEAHILGDIIISYPQAVKQAGEKGRLVDDEINFLIDHAMHHLLGQHHD